MTDRRRDCPCCSRIRCLLSRSCVPVLRGNRRERREGGPDTPNPPPRRTVAPSQSTESMAKFSGSSRKRNLSTGSGSDRA